MPQTIEFPPVQNGLDYLASAIEHLRGQPSPRNLKYAVLHLQAAAEVLLKARLIREHWSLAFPKPDKANRGDFNSGAFQSIGLKEAIARLKDRVAIDLPTAAQKSFDKLGKERNKLQHFGLVCKTMAIESLTGEVLDALLCFIVEHLRPGADPDELTDLDATQELIREEMERINGLAKARWERITPELDRLAEYVITCPGCLNLALLLDGTARCWFCDRVWDDGNDAAEEYAANILNITWYDVKDGADPAVRICPDCEHEAFLADVVVRVDPTNPMWLCLQCGMTAKEEDINECVRCGEPMLHDEESAICPSCWTDIISRD